MMNSRMSYRATVQRNTETGTDSHGNPLTGVWAAHILSLPCWVYNDSKRLVIDGNKTATVQGLKVAISLGADVTEQDRITTIQNRRGQTIFSGVYEIRQILRVHNHREADLRLIE